MTTANYKLLFIIFILSITSNEQKMPSKLFIATTPNNYEETSLNYPKDCPQEMGIKVGY